MLPKKVFVAHIKSTYGREAGGRVWGKKSVQKIPSNFYELKILFASFMPTNDGNRKQSAIDFLFIDFPGKIS